METNVKGTLNIRGVGDDGIFSSSLKIFSLGFEEINCSYNNGNGK
jgi:hypothetical protein